MPSKPVKPVKPAGHTRPPPRLRPEFSDLAGVIAESRRLDFPEYLEFTPPDSAAFRRWFGSSKVTDEHGRPKVVFHGTSRAPFTVFKADPHDWGGSAFFFTDQPAVARSYRPEAPTAWGKSAKNPEAAPGTLFSVYLSIQRPHEVDAEGRGTREVFPEAIEAARLVGADGVIVRNIRNSAKFWDNDEVGTTYVVFSPSQIKSAARNQGTWDPSDPDIERMAEKVPAETDGQIEIPRAWRDQFDTLAHALCRTQFNNYLLPTRKELLAFARKHGLKLLGFGMSRVVFDMKPWGALKIELTVLDGPRATGSYPDNDAEIEFYQRARPEVRRFLVPVLAWAEDHRWLIQERVQPGGRITEEARRALRRCGIGDIPVGRAMDRNVAKDGRVLDYAYINSDVQREDCMEPGPSQVERLPTDEGRRAEVAARLDATPVPPGAWSLADGLYEKILAWDGRGRVPTVSGATFLAMGGTRMAYRIGDVVVKVAHGTQTDLDVSQGMNRAEAEAWRTAPARMRRYLIPVIGEDSSQEGLYLFMPYVDRLPAHEASKGGAFCADLERRFPSTFYDCYHPPNIGVVDGVLFLLDYADDVSAWQFTDEDEAPEEGEKIEHMLSRRGSRVEHLRAPLTPVTLPVPGVPGVTLHVTGHLNESDSEWVMAPERGPGSVRAVRFPSLSVTVKALAGETPVGQVTGVTAPPTRRQGGTLVDAACQAGLDTLRARFPEIRGVLYVGSAAIPDPARRGQGLGKAMYVALLAVAARHGFTVTRQACATGNEHTSADALRVWRSLEAAFPSAGGVVYAGQTGQSPDPGRAGRTERMGLVGEGTLRFERAPPKHPFGPGLGRAGAYGPDHSVHTYLPPEVFLRFTDSPPDDPSWRGKRDEEKIAKYAARMRKTKPPAAFPVLWLLVRSREDGSLEVTNHEGRHRAMAAILAGVPRVPVAVVWGGGGKVPSALVGWSQGTDTPIWSQGPHFRHPRPATLIQSCGAVRVQGKEDIHIERLAGAHADPPTKDPHGLTPEDRAEFAEIAKGWFWLVERADGEFTGSFQRGMRAWAAEQGFDVLGLGSSRVVLGLRVGGRDVALKVAHWRDDTHSNAVEVQVWTHAPARIKRHLVPLLAWDTGNKDQPQWVLMERVEPNEGSSVRHMPKGALGALMDCGLTDFHGANLSADGRVLDYGYRDDERAWERCVQEGDGERQEESGPVERMASGRARTPGRIDRDYGECDRIFRAAGINLAPYEECYEVFRVDGEVVAASSFGWKEDGDEGASRRVASFSVAVLPGYRRRGIAERLVQSILNKHPNTEFEPWVVSPKMAKLLEGLGFSPESSRGWSQDAPHMRYTTPRRKPRRLGEAKAPASAKSRAPRHPKPGPSTTLRVVWRGDAEGTVREVLGALARDEAERDRWIKIWHPWVTLTRDGYPNVEFLSARARIYGFKDGVEVVGLPDHRSRPDLG